MEPRETGKQGGERRRFERFNIIFPILLAGWVPSILTLYISYTILSKTLESKILTDRQSFVQLIGHLVGDDLSRTGGIIDYYQNAPDAAQLLSGASNPAATQQWLSSAFYSHPRIDEMCLTSADGRLVLRSTGPGHDRQGIRSGVLAGSGRSFKSTVPSPDSPPLFR